MVTQDIPRVKAFYLTTFEDSAFLPDGEVCHNWYAVDIDTDEPIKATWSTSMDGCLEWAREMLPNAAFIGVLVSVNAGERL